MIFAHLDSDPILLMLDNSQVTHNACLHIVQNCLSEGLSVMDTGYRLRRYCLSPALTDLRKAGDREQANVLAESCREVSTYNDTDQENYWFGVAQYYIQKVNEGC